MKDLIPLIQSLIWPLFFLLLIGLFRRPAGEIFEIIKKRIDNGSEFSVNFGQGGFTVGEAPAMEPVENAALGDLSGAFENMEGRLGAEVGVEEDGHEESLAAHALRKAKLSASYHLVHVGQHDQAETARQGRSYYRVKVQLLCDHPEGLAVVNKVVYFLHPQLPEPVREITTQDNQFTLEFYTWGRFNLRAELFIMGDPEPIVLSRYLNF